MAARRLPPFERLGAFMHEHRRAVIGVWLAVLLLALPFAPQAPGALQAGGFDLPTLESARAAAVSNSIEPGTSVSDEIASTSA
ncbi:MAG: hypothetical protein ACKOQO_05560, partial [Candidatus Limnocylindrus sp.]